jgi:prepilin-type N-terminal cleavage/methylation domain-containing protein
MIAFSGKKSPDGFSLLECLIGIVLFGFISLAGMEFFDLSRRTFIQLQSSEQAATDVFAAVDIITRDIQAAGAELQKPVDFGLLIPVAEEGNNLLCLHFVEQITFQGDLFAGQTAIPLSRPSTASGGADICLFDSNKGERIRLSKGSKYLLNLSIPLENDYRSEQATIFLLKKIAFYHDKKSHVLRRRVNSSPAQPLCEQSDSFSFNWDAANQLLTMTLSAGGKNGIKYQTKICPKNCRMLFR